MRPSLALSQHRDAVFQAAARYRVTNPRVFGSASRGDDHDGSDLDLLVEFDQAPGFFRFIELEDQLGRHLGLKVDLVMRTALRPQIGQRVLAEAVPV